MRASGGRDTACTEPGGICSRSTLGAGGDVLRMARAPRWRGPGGGRAAWTPPAWWCGRRRSLRPHSPALSAPAQPTPACSLLEPSLLGGHAHIHVAWGESNLQRPCSAHSHRRGQTDEGGTGRRSGRGPCSTPGAERCFSFLGRDFSHDETLDVPTQVELLIKQATSHENLCQCYIGW